MKNLYEKFMEHAIVKPDRTALLWSEGSRIQTMSYGELKKQAICVAGYLKQSGVMSGDRIAVTLPRGCEQIVGVLGILLAGAVYVPIGIMQPKKRRERIYERAEIHYVLTDTENQERVKASGVTVLDVAEREERMQLKNPIHVKQEDEAYIIFTSGSTGEPKGVCISHGAAINTIEDINQRFQVTNADRCFAVSALDFDLSVYDIFGLLSAGGSIVLLSEETQKEAAQWQNLIQKTQVTIWNSVPALLDMLLSSSDESGLFSIRLALISGDWIPLDLPERFKEKTKTSRFISLGGATECSIWSNFYEVKEIKPEWKSIPYGSPLTNQYFRVVSADGIDCRANVPGELWIGGDGVAIGYAGDEKLTNERFTWNQGKRWYHTGDLGQFWEDGTMEFLGRMDRQVKLHGYRIELGEIEAALKRMSGIENAVAVITEYNHGQHLNAVITSEQEKKEPGWRKTVLTKKREMDYSGQHAVIEPFLVRLLELSRIFEQQGKADFKMLIEKNKIVSENIKLLLIWMNYLCEREVVRLEAGCYFKGRRYEEAEKEWHKKDGQQSEILKTLSIQWKQWKEFLAGGTANFLLDQEALSPETLTAEDKGTLEGIRRIAKAVDVKANQSSVFAKKDDFVKVAVLGARSGILAQKLIQSVKAQNVSFTLFDSANSMLLTAKRRLDRETKEIQFGLLNEEGMKEEYLHQYDMVVAINSLHQYPKASQGISIASVLLKKKGQFLILEHDEMAPIGLITAAVLEHGFEHLEQKRKKVYSPMLRGEQWMDILGCMGFNQRKLECIPGTITNYLETVYMGNSACLTAERMKEQLRKELPPYMIPEQLELLYQLPLTANGKVDRKGIAKRFEKQEEQKFEAPHPGIESEVSGMWTKLLQVDKINRKSSFFMIGGDSLLATRFIAMVQKKWEVKLALKEIFHIPHLYQIAGWIEENVQRQQELEGMMEEGEI